MNKTSKDDNELQRVYELVNHWHAEAMRWEAEEKKRQAEIESLRAAIRVKDADYQRLRAAYEGRSVETTESVPVDEHERYKRCLYRANGRLIQMGQEPEKLDYPPVKATGSLKTPQGEPALTPPQELPGTREPVVIEPQGNAGESPALDMAATLRIEAATVKLGECMPAGRFPEGVSRYNALMWAAELIEERAALNGSEQHG